MTEQQKIDERRKFIHAFNSTMFKIWHEKIALLKVVDTGALYRSVGGFQQARTNADASEAYLRQDFLTYGIFQNWGTGREVPRGNPGDIGRPKVRVARRWFDKKYFGSVMNTREFLADSFCRQYIAIFANAFSDSALRAQTIKS